jgi:hypothetical protein
LFSQTRLDVPEVGALEVVESVDFDITLCNTPNDRSGYGLSYGVYLTLGNSELWFGLQTQIFRPGIGNVGAGFLFTRYGSINEAEIRVNPQGGYSEVGTPESDFIGVRLAHELLATTYHVQLKHEGEQWYALSFTREGGSSIHVGSLRLSTTQGISSFFIDPVAYGTEGVLASDIPFWYLNLSAPRVNDHYATGGWIGYPSPEYPFGSVVPRTGPNGSLLEFVFGGLSQRAHGVVGAFSLP